MFRLHLLLGRNARQFVDVFNDRRIVHAAHSDDIDLGQLSSERLFELLCSDFFSEGLDPFPFQPDVVS